MMKKHVRLLAGVLISTLLSSVAFPVYAGWIRGENAPVEAGLSSWRYSTTSANDIWYSGNPVLWQWIDGNKDGIAECYAFNAVGWMFADATTPDGYIVNAEGAWVVDGVVQTKIVPTTTTSKRSGSGGSSSSGSGSKKSSAKTVPQVPESKSEPEAPAAQSTESEQPGKIISFSYTIQYKDIESRAVLRQEVGQAEIDSTIEIAHPFFDDYMICNNQPGSLKLSYDNLKETIYYRKVEEATSSNAKEIEWKILFTDSETNQKELLPARSGTILEGGVLSVNYMQTITVDGVIWEAIEKPPFEIEVYGPGNQMYKIEFDEIGTVTETEDPYAEEKELLEGWLSTAKEAESEITGESIDSMLESGFIVANKAQNDARIRSITNQINDEESYVFYVLGKNYIPNGIAIAEWFGTNAEYSITKADSIQIDEDTYTIVRFSITITIDTDLCTHRWEISEENAATCLSRGTQIYVCEKCRKEVVVYVPATGHLDANGDSICDTCGDFINNSLAAGSHWNLGDMQAQVLDGEIYFFECIDQNYTDEANNQNQTALFLCTTIIPANYGSSYNYELQADGTHDYVFYPGEIVNFGAGNDYKYSQIRKFLKRLEGDTVNLADTNIGVSYAYMGATEQGTFEQFHEFGLTPSYIGNQKMVDQMFILSVDEALKYREYLWNLDETGAYAKGYWLRTPMGSGSNHDTDYVYIVDIVNGCIRPQAIRPDSSDSDEEINVTGTTGVRPAYTMPQY